jgi:hypothetical protein
MVRHCSGGIILGFEQFRSTAGQHKPNSRKEQKAESPTTFATPWNQLEAGILFSADLPMMICRERRYCRRHLRYRDIRGLHTSDAESQNDTASVGRPRLRFPELGRTGSGAPLPRLRPVLSEALMARPPAATSTQQTIRAAWRLHPWTPLPAQPAHVCPNPSSTSPREALYTREAASARRRPSSRQDSLQG